MIRIEKKIMDELGSSTNIEDLHFWVQKAIELEHSTIPPYLTAAFSIPDGESVFVKEALMDIAKEEMLHFMIGCNLLLSLGGQPKIYFKEFIPNYPCPLPMSINSLTVGLEKASKNVIEKVFMEIEEPEKPIDFPVIEVSFLKDKIHYEFATIGQFYNLIKEKINQLDNFPGEIANQITNESVSPFQENLFPIRTKEDAIKAIDIIVEQGEGTTQLPTFGTNHSLAHYYRFKQIVKGKKLIEDKTTPKGYSYSGTIIEFDENKMYPLYPNLKINDLQDGDEKDLLMKFNKQYSKMLLALDNAFKGVAGEYNKSIKAMRNLTIFARTVVSTKHPTKQNFNISPTFEFVEL